MSMQLQCAECVASTVCGCVLASGFVGWGFPLWLLSEKKTRYRLKSTFLFAKVVFLSVGKRMERVLGSACEDA